MNPLLSICIPIYNRLPYLERQLTRLLEDKDLFEEKIQLIVSDNCSEDDLSSCCRKYRDYGLNLTYNRNPINLGSNGNFEWCFENVKGKYTWLLGSDDIPVPGCVRKVIDQLEREEYGLLHLSMIPGDKALTIYNNYDMVEAVSYWITYMSSNIFASKYIQSVNIHNYCDTWLIQVPVYLKACLSSNKNLMMNIGHPFEYNNDALNNGGYNFFRVFIENLLGIYNEFVEKGLLPKQSFLRIKKKEYKEYLVGFIVDTLILRAPRRKKFDMADSWKIIWTHYGNKPYAYYYTVKHLARRLLGQ